MSYYQCRCAFVFILALVFSGVVNAGGATYVAPSAAAQQKLDALTQERQQIMSDSRNKLITPAEQRYRLEENALRRENVHREDMGLTPLTDQQIQAKAQANASAQESQLEQIRTNNASRSTDSSESVEANKHLYRKDDSSTTSTSKSAGSGSADSAQSSSSSSKADSSASQTQSQASANTSATGGSVTPTATNSSATGGAAVTPTATSNSAGTGSTASIGSSGASSGNGSSSGSNGSGTSSGYNSSNDGSNVAVSKTNTYRTGDGHTIETSSCGGDICVKKINTETGEIVDSEMVKPGQVDSTVNGMNGGKAPEFVSTQTTGADGQPVQSSTGQTGAEGTVPPATPEQIAQAKSDIPASASGAADKATTPTGTPAPDPTAAAKLSKAESADAALNTQIEAIKKQIATVEPQATAEANTKCAASTTDGKLLAECVSQLINVSLTCVKTNYLKLEAASKELAVAKKSCSSSSVQAEQLCSMVRSEKAQMVQQLMGVGAAVLSKVTSASESCKTTSGFSKLAQGGMLLAQGTCTAMKVRCDMTCASAQKALTEMQVATKALMACKLSALTATQAAGASLEAATTKLQTQLTQQLSPKGDVPMAIVQCEKHKVDILAMGQAALGFLSAHQDAKKCQEQLTAGGGTGSSTAGGAKSSMTTAEYCAVPSNSSSITCKCTANPNAEGCMGNIASQGISLGKIGSGSGASAFASAGGQGLAALKPDGKNPSATGSGQGGLSSAAREIFGMDSSGGASAGGVNGSAPSAGAEVAALGKGGNPAGPERRSFNFSAGAGGAGFGGSASRSGKTDAAKSYAEKLAEEQQRRKLASEQMRAEISAASGRSNFEKISSRYRSNSSSFEE